MNYLFIVFLSFGLIGRARHYLPMAKVASSPIGRDTIVGGVLHPARQLTRFSPPNMPYIVNSKFI